MKIEYEIRFLEVDKESMCNKLKEIGAEYVGEWDQIRKTYDFFEKKDNAWVRLRTNGETTTLTIKEVNSKKIDGTKELEIVVSDFEETDRILEKIGLKSRNFQQNKRMQFNYKGGEIVIDSWPLIPDYMEIEADNEETIIEICKDLDFNYQKGVTLDVTSIYKDVYGIDILKIKELKF